MSEKIKSLSKEILEAGDVPEPEVAAVKLQVRTDAAVPPPHWLCRMDDERDPESPAS